MLEQPIEPGIPMTFHSDIKFKDWRHNLKSMSSQECKVKEMNAPIFAKSAWSVVDNEAYTEIKMGSMHSKHSSVLAIQISGWTL